MPTPSLTREEAADRTERVHPHRCEVDLDLTGAPDAARRTFPVEVAWTFSFDRADGPDETFLDFTGEVLELEINGRSLSAEEIAAAFAQDLTRLSRWLGSFSAASLVSLDYGSLADRIQPDESPQDMADALDLLHEGDLGSATAALRRIFRRWAPLAQLQQAN